MSEIQPSLSETLALEPAGEDRFVSAVAPGRGHVFGGLLVAQALHAAARTLPTPQPARSLHASFVIAGKGGHHLHHEVERTRDGMSFATRRVVVRQAGDRVVLVLTADFHREEHGADFEQPATPGVPGPEGLAVGRYSTRFVESRDVPVADAPTSPLHARRAWFHPVDTVADDVIAQQCTLAFLSDHGPTRAAREPHAHLDDDARRQSVSLDHSVWFHRPIDVNQWLLSELTPVATAHGRGLAVGTIRTADGMLLASVAQEVLLRHR